MKTKFAGAAMIAITIAGCQVSSPPQNAGGAVSLEGKVISAEEGAMEGVLVSARKDGSTITVTVVTDEQGRYSFPKDRLEPGHYTLTTRATSYDLGGAGSADVVRNEAAEADLKLVKLATSPLS